MANMTDCMIRNLQRFVQLHLMGIVFWNECETLVPSDGDGNVAEIRFRRAWRRHAVRCESSEFAPPLGRVLLDSKPMGPIDEGTWTKIAQNIKEPELLDG